MRQGILRILMVETRIIAKPYFQPTWLWKRSKA